MIRRSIQLGLMAVLMFILFSAAASADVQTSPAIDQVQSVPSNSNSTQQWTLYAVIALAIGNVTQWLNQIIQAAKERRAAEEAEAEEAQAKAEEAKAKAAQAASLDPSQLGMLHAHETKLGQHDIEIAALKDSYRKYEKENREDHGKIFDKLEGIRTLIAGLKTGGSQ